MSKIQWERDLVELPFCEQLQAMGWQWFEGGIGERGCQPAQAVPPPVGGMGCGEKGAEKRVDKS